MGKSLGHPRASDQMAECLPWNVFGVMIGPGFVNELSFGTLLERLVHAQLNGTYSLTPWDLELVCFIWDVFLGIAEPHRGHCMRRHLGFLAMFSQTRRGSSAKPGYVLRRRRLLFVGRP